MTLPMRPIAEGPFTNEAFPRLIGRRIRCGGGLRRVYENASLRQDIYLLAVDLYGDAGLQLDTSHPLYGENAPAPVHSKGAQAAARYLNSRAWSIFGGTNEIQAGIIAKTVLGL